MDVTLTGDVSLRRPPQSEDAAHDLKQLKIALNRLGFYTPAPDTGMTDEIDNQLADAIYAFQRWATIYFDDTQIGPGSTTERILNEELAVQDDGHGLYIWRTVQDDHVRHDHAVRDGRRFYWNDPPDGGNPGEDYNCRCWAEPIALPYHPWKEWVREREAKRRVEENLAPEKGLANVDPVLIQPGLDAINPTLSPLDFIGFGGMAARAAFRAAAPVASSGLRAVAEEIPNLARFRDTEWIRHADIRQIQHAFSKAMMFGIKGNWNKKNGELFKDALQKHIRSSETKIIKGSYHNEPATHYYNPKTKLNVIQNKNGEFVSGWKLKEEQIYHMENGGKLGGSKK